MLVTGCSALPSYCPTQAYEVSVCGDVYSVITSDNFGRMNMYSRETIAEYNAVERHIKMFKSINIVPESGCAEIM